MESNVSPCVHRNHLLQLLNSDRVTYAEGGQERDNTTQGGSISNRSKCRKLVYFIHQHKTVEIQSVNDRERLVQLTKLKATENRK